MAPSQKGKLADGEDPKPEHAIRLAPARQMPTPAPHALVHTQVPALEPRLVGGVVRLALGREAALLAARLELGVDPLAHTYVFSASVPSATVNRRS